jgi:hypothetical protein
LQQKNQESNKIDETSQGIMTYRINPFAGNLEYIHLYYVYNFLPLASFQGNIVIPVRKFISCKSPVNPENEIKEKHERTYKMDETYCPEPVIERGFGTFHKSDRAADKITGYAKR